MNFARNRKCKSKGKRGAVALVLVSLVATGITGTVDGASAAPVVNARSTELPAAPVAEGVVLVGYDSGTNAAERRSIRTEVDATQTTGATKIAPDVERVRLESGVTVAEAVTELTKAPGVRFAEPDYKLQRAEQSDDPMFTDGSLWGMYGDGTSPTNQFGSQAGEAWAQGHVGSRDVYVGVIDEGVQIDHPDLAANMWTNPFDPADGVDNDGNGYIDDTRGWDFHYDDNSVYDGDGAGMVDAHGTHVAGTIAGVGGNATGVAGVNWRATVIPAKFLGPGGGYTSDAVEAVDYLTDMKVRHGLNIVASSNSWGGGGHSQALLDAIDRGGDAGILFVAAAGNSMSDNDAYPVYPTGYECTKGGTRGWDCVVSVAALEPAGGLAYFSNHGATTVDLGAPGTDVWSTVPGGYAPLSGTSMATPHVSGAVALCASINRSVTANHLRGAVLDAVASTPALAGRTVTGGRLDVGSMLSHCGGTPTEPGEPVTGKPRGLRVTSAGVDTVGLRWVDGAEHEEQFQVQRAPSLLGFCGRFRNVATAPANATSVVVTGLAPAKRHCFRVRAVSSAGGGSASRWSNLVHARTTRDYTCRSTRYVWIDPRIGGTNLQLGDDASSTVTLPFPVTFYGQTTSTITVSSNGFVRFDGTPAPELGTEPIPSAVAPNNFAAPLWDDLNPGAGGGVWVRTMGVAPHRKLVVGWVDVPHFGGTDPVSVQLVLIERDGGITFTYKDTGFGDPAFDRGASATAGIENPTGTRGKQVAFNTPSLESRAAYRCATDGFRF
jgi:subtilisin family serine protease